MTNDVRPTTGTKVILQDLVKRSNALTALLLTREGTNITEAGDTDFINTTALAALIAGMFSATREVARMVGEHQFAVLLQQGENRHIHISLIGEATILVIVFEDISRIGLVRHEARKHAKALVEQLMRPVDQAIKKEISIPHFREYALNLIDRIFKVE